MNIYESYLVKEQI